MDLANQYVEYEPSLLPPDKKIYPSLFFTVLLYDSKCNGQKNYFLLLYFQ